MAIQTIREKPSENHQEDRGKPARWRPFVSSGGTVVGVAIAAAVTSYTAEKAVGIAAWVAVAVVGASTMISTAKNVK